MPSGVFFTLEASLRSIYPGGRGGSGINEPPLAIDLDIGGVVGGIGGEASDGADGGGGVDEDHFLADDGNQFSAALGVESATSAVEIDGGVTEEAGSSPGFGLVDFLSGESAPGRGLAEIAIDIEISRGAGVFIGRGGIPARVNHENVLVLDHGQKVADELAVRLRDAGDEFFDAARRGVGEDGVHGGSGRAVAGEGFAEAVFHEPFVGAGAVVVGELLDVALAVEQDIENIVVISAAEACARELEQEVDHAARIGAAVDIVADEDPAWGGILFGDGFDQSLEGDGHAVNVTDDPSHANKLPANGWHGQGKLDVLGKRVRGHYRSVTKLNGFGRRKLHRRWVGSGLDRAKGSA
jgi:hypothetical protein